ncbi:petrobactin import system permease protein YclO [Paraliobacillus ryukyuensis]|uniref:Iron complex transport system permease protein n=1 Tax=Paraliobacillus ryukyuensis TaxID=200904 RepID=A0A366E997_9BACI|nr:iron chelate uptake ABC transporter family permease subunit [Paraliobacillus ryukyuensis]RBO98044.1 iron complex transport system permease protein [Paraliobacillus ryukyuensis]
MRLNLKISIIIILALTIVSIFLFAGIPSHWNYILPRRFEKVLAIVMTGTVIAIATVVFQTITNNRILTPSVIGLGSLYTLLQTFIVFVFGVASIASVNQTINFILSVIAMMVFAFVLYQLLFKKQQNVYFLLLVGLVFGTFFSSLSSFMQVLIDPNDFLSVQNKLFASFNSIHTAIIPYAFGIILLSLAYFWRFIKYLDVMALGKSHAINLGINYDYMVKRLLIIIAVWISVATALVGPILFLGLLVANVTYEFLQTHKHAYLLPSAALISIIALVGGQLIVERVFTFNTTISVILNFIGGVYFLYLILKENKAW